MVYRLICVGLVLAFPFFMIASAQASYCGPGVCAPPLKVPVYGNAAPGMMPPPPMAGPAMAGPRPMAGCFPQPCPPPSCGPDEGFNPIAKLFSVITFPFRLIGSAFTKKQCEQNFCAPQGCMPLAPPCGPPPVTKCKPGPMQKAPVFGYGPMGYN